MFAITGHKVMKVGEGAQSEPFLRPGLHKFGVSIERGIFLTHVAYPKPYRMPARTFGNTYERLGRIWRTWEGRRRNTGVLLHGMAGTGKSFLLKAAISRCYEEQIPVVMLDSVPDIERQLAILSKQGMNRAMLAIDEGEKILSDQNDQEALLSFMDGTVDSNFLIILAANQTALLDEHFFNHPGRFFYSWEYGPLDENTVRQVVEANLNDENKGRIAETVFALMRLEDRTFDVVTSVVEDMNIHSCTVGESLEAMNVGVDLNRWRQARHIALAERNY